MRISDFNRTAACGVVAFVAAGALRSAAMAGGFTHVGPALVSLEGAMWSGGGTVIDCGGFGMDVPGSQIRVSRTSEDFGSWPMHFPSEAPSPLVYIEGGTGCDTVASIVRNGAHIEFSASFDRLELDGIVEHIVSSRDGDLTGKGAIGFGRGDASDSDGTLLGGSARFVLTEASAIEISAEVSVENPVAEGFDFRSETQWRIERVNGFPEGAGMLAVETSRSVSGTVSKGSEPKRVVLGAGEYVVTFGLAAKGWVQHCGGGGTMIRSWASAEHARIRLSMEGGCEADLDGSGYVDGGDLAILLMEYGGSGGLADFDGSGLVDGGDLAVMLLYYGPCS